MNCKVIYIVSLGLVINCVMSADTMAEGGQGKEGSAKNFTERLSVNRTSEIFSEGNSSINVPSQTSRIKGRKGAVPGPPSIELESSNGKIESIDSSSTEKSIVNSTMKPIESIKVSTATTTTTKKPIRKPTNTVSADDDPQILESEKNINYNISKIDFTTPPKTSSDTDRTMNDEKQTRRSYVMFMGLFFAVPMTFTLVHVLYKKVKNWLEVREYQRVDFLVDGMYIS